MKLNTIFKLICTLYVSAFFMSCKDPNEVGNSLLKEQVSTTFIDTFNIETEVVYYPEDLVSNKATSITVGKFIDENLGEITAKSFFQLRLSEENIPIDENAIVDSVVFFLPYKINMYQYAKDGAKSDYHFHAQFVGDTTKSQTIFVHELNEQLITGKKYTVNDAVSYSSTPLGSAIQNVNPIDGYTYSTSLKKVTNLPTFKIPLAKELGVRLLNLARNGTQANFLANFNGLALVSDGSDASILNFDHLSSAEKMAVYVYYRTSKNENYYYRFYVNVDSENFNRIESNRSSVALNSLQKSGDRISTNNLNHFAYLQSGTGIQTQIKIPHLKKFLTENPLISIDKAEIILSVEKDIPLYAYENGPTPTVTLRNVKNNLVEKATDTTYVEIRNDASVHTTASYGFGYNATKLTYTFPLTGYIQELALNKKELESLIIAPSLNATRVNFTRFYDNHSSNGDNAIKLRIYYTKVQ